MSGHTPGPWSHALSDDDDDYFRLAHEVMGAWQGDVRTFVGGCQKLEDARLIAAAPELLSAGLRVTTAFRALGDSTGMVDSLTLKRECELAMLALDRAIAKGVGS